LPLKPIQVTGNWSADSNPASIEGPFITVDNILYVAVCVDDRSDSAVSDCRVW